MAGQRKTTTGVPVAGEAHIRRVAEQSVPGEKKPAVSIPAQDWPCLAKVSVLCTAALGWQPLPMEPDNMVITSRAPTQVCGGDFQPGNLSWTCIKLQVSTWAVLYAIQPPQAPLSFPFMFMDHPINTAFMAVHMHWLCLVTTTLQLSTTPNLPSHIIEL